MAWLGLSLTKMRREGVNQSEVRVARPGSQTDLRRGEGISYEEWLERSTSIFPLGRRSLNG